MFNLPNSNLVKTEEFILTPTRIGQSKGFIIPKNRIKLEKKKYIVIIIEVNDLCNMLR